MMTPPSRRCAQGPCTRPGQYSSPVHEREASAVNPEVWYPLVSHPVRARLTPCLAVRDSSWTAHLSEEECEYTPGLLASARVITVGVQPLPVVTTGVTVYKQ